MRKIGNFMNSFFFFLPYKNIKITKLMYKNSNPWSILVKIKVSLIVKYFQDEIYLIFINFIPLKVPMYAWCLGWYSVTYSLSSTNKRKIIILSLKKKKFYNIFNEFYNPSNKKFNSFVIILISEKFFLLNRQIEYLEMTTVRYKCFDSFS